MAKSDNMGFVTWDSFSPSTGTLDSIADWLFLPPYGSPAALNNSARLSCYHIAGRSLYFFPLVLRLVLTRMTGMVRTRLTSDAEGLQLKVSDFEDFVGEAV